MIKLSVPHSQVKEILEEDETIKNISRFLPKISQQGN
jgi:hypothetical protein